MYEWNVGVWSEPGRLDYNVLFYIQNGNQIKALGSDGTVKDYDRGSAIPPTLALQPDMLQALANVLAEKNIKPKDATKIEGLYEAQSEHLKDLRKLLKL